jgi:hypothetical protein
MKLHRGRDHVHGLVASCREFCVPSMVTSADPFQMGGRRRRLADSALALGRRPQRVERRH